MKEDEKYQLLLEHTQFETIETKKTNEKNLT